MFITAYRDGKIMIAIKVITTIGFERAALKSFFIISITLPKSRFPMINLKSKFINIIFLKKIYLLIMFIKNNI